MGTGALQKPEGGPSRAHWRSTPDSRRLAGVSTLLPGPWCPHCPKHPPLEQQSPQRSRSGGSRSRGHPGGPLPHSGCLEGRWQVPVLCGGFARLSSAARVPARTPHALLSCPHGAGLDEDFPGDKPSLASCAETIRQPPAQVAPAPRQLRPAARDREPGSEREHCGGIWGRPRLLAYWAMPSLPEPPPTVHSSICPQQDGAWDRCGHRC